MVLCQLHNFCNYFTTQLEMKPALLLWLLPAPSVVEIELMLQVLNLLIVFQFNEYTQQFMCAFRCPTIA